MKEGRDRTVHLNTDVDDPDAFAGFSQYSYFQDYLHDLDDGPALLLHAKVYVLAEKLECLPLKDLSFRKANLLLGAAHSNNPNHILPSLPSAISTIYEYTYDSHYERMFKENSESGSTNTADGDQADGSVRCGEKFRFLLAAFASSYLSKLRKDKSFISVYRRFPDFATNVVMLAEADINVGVDQDGLLPQ
ncbi:hypothetical protein AA313_de0206365 [Arthrobotrys entomopaga]|nr:hypothetical protein AA313_de0206365 [Arthrobotrys entomopaga]